MHVIRRGAKIGMHFFGEFIQVVDRNTVLLHYFFGRFVVSRGIFDKPAGLTFRHIRGVHKQQSCIGCCFDQFHNRIEICRVFFWRKSNRTVDFIALALRFRIRMPVSQIPQSPVKLHNIPIALANPFEHIRQAGAGMLGIPRIMLHNCHALKHLRHMRRIPDRNRIANNQNTLLIVITSPEDGQQSQ